MRFIPTFIHGVLDYVICAMIVALPFIFGWTGPLRWIVIAMALLGLVYTLFTDFEVGIVHFVPLRLHLFLDFLFGIVFFALPWFFNVTSADRMAFYAIGVIAIFLSLATKTQAKGDAARSYI